MEESNMNEYLTIKEQKILEKIEMIHGVLNMGYAQEKVEKDFYYQTKLQLDELFKMVNDKFKGDIR